MRLWIRPIAAALLSLTIGCTGGAAPAGRTPDSSPMSGVSPVLDTAPRTIDVATPMRLQTPTSVPAPLPTRFPSTTLRIVEAMIEPPRPYVAGGFLYLDADVPPRPLAYQPSPLCGDMGGVLLTADRQRALYSGTGRLLPPGPAGDPARLPALGERIAPALRRVDLRTGEDTVLEEGACAPAVATDGRLAYLKGEHPTGANGEPYPGRVLVRDGLDAAPAPWTTVPGEYEGLRWAGVRLLAYRLAHPMPWVTLSDLVILDGPDRVRSLGPVRLVAISSDGSRALVTRDEMYSATASLVRIADGEVLSRLPLGPAGTLDNLAGGGVWVGDRVITRNGIVSGGTAHPLPHVVVVDVSGDTLVIASMFGLPDRYNGVGPFAGIGGLRPLDAGGDVIGLWWVYAGTRYLACDLPSRQCRIGGPMRPWSFFPTIPERSGGK